MLTLLDNPWLDNPALCWILEAYDGSCPLTLTNDRATTAMLGLGPRIYSTRDLQGIPFTTGPRAQRVQYDRLIRQASYTAYWRLAEFTGSPTVTSDVSTGSPITLAWAGGGSTTSVAGPLAGDASGALGFDGSHYLIGGDDDRLDLHTTSRWWSAWFKTTATSGGMIYAKCADSSATNGVILDIGTGLAGRARVNVHGVSATAAGGYNDGAWHHVYAHLDRSAQQLVLSIDGIEVARVSAAALGSTDLNTTRGPTIGALDTGSPLLYFNGSLARVVQGSGTLTPEQVWAQYSAGLWFTEAAAERRLVSVPVFTQTAPLEFEGLQPLESISYDLANGDGDLTEWLDGEYRGKVHRWHLYDATTGTLVEDVFYGELAAIRQHGRVVSCTDTAVPLYGLNDVIPRRRIRSSQFLTTQANGAPLSRGWGFCEGMPGRSLTATPLETDTLPALDPQDGWRFAIGAGNYAIGLLYQGGVATFDRATFGVSSTVIDGEAATVVQLYDDPAGAPITVDARRLPDRDQHARAEWDFMAGWDEKIAGLSLQPGTVRGAAPTSFLNLEADRFLSTVYDVIPDEDAGTDALLSVGKFLGAVRFNGTSDYLETGPCPDSFQWQTFTVETTIEAAASTQNGTIVCGPYSPYVASGDVPAWQLRFLTTGAMSFVYRTGVNTTHTVTETFGSFTPTAAEHTITVVKEPGRVTFARDGLTIFTTTTSVVPIVYPTSGPICRALLVGRSISATTPDYFLGRVGWTRLSCVVRDEPERERNSYILRGSPVEALREVFTQELGITCDVGYSWTVARAAVAAAVPALPDALRVDGFYSEDLPAVTVIAWLCRFRDLRLGRNAGGVTCTVPVAQTQAVAAFASGAPQNNVTGEPERLRPSTAEAMRSLMVTYQPRRDLDGRVAVYQQQVPFALAAVGREGVPFELPLVRDHACADIIGEWLQKRLLQRTQLYAFPVGHEARGVRVGQCVRATLPQFQKSNVDMDVLSIGLAPAAASLQVAPYDAAVFTYVGGRTLPQAAAKRYVYLHPGTDQSLAYGNGIVAVTLGKNFTQVPTRTGARMEWDFPNSPAWSVVADSNDATFLTVAKDAGQAFALFGSDALPSTQVPEGYGVVSIDLIVRAKYSTGSVRNLEILHRLPDLTGPNGWLTQVAGSFGLTTSFANYTASITSRPDGTPLQLGDIDRLDWGARPAAGNDANLISLAECSRVVKTGPLEAPKALGVVKVWVRSVGAATPVDGADRADAIDEGTFRIGLTLGTGSYWLWAGVYDQANRRIAFIGPQAVTV